MHRSPPHVGDAGQGGSLRGHHRARSRVGGARRRMPVAVLRISPHRCHGCLGGRCARPTRLGMPSAHLAWCGHRGARHHDRSARHVSRRGDHRCAVSGPGDDPHGRRCARHGSGPRGAPGGMGARDGLRGASVGGRHVRGARHDHGSTAGGHPARAARHDHGSTAGGRPGPVERRGWAARREPGVTHRHTGGCWRCATQQTHGTRATRAGRHRARNARGAASSWRQPSGRSSSGASWRCRASSAWVCGSSRVAGGSRPTDPDGRREE